MDGRSVSKTWKENIAKQTAGLIAQGVTPHLAVVLVGANPASQVYVRNKENSCVRAGIRSTVIRLEETCTQDALEDVVRSLNADVSVHGILVQLPLPQHLSEAAVIAAIDPRKDVDCFHAENVGLLQQGTPRFLPCTPAGVVALLDTYQIPLVGKRCVVIGRSNIVGKPLASMLLARDATVTVCHSKTANLAQICREADILIAAAGKSGLVCADMVKPGAAVIDVGINRTADGKLCGDVAFAEIAEKAGYLTPVPGGVGPMTITMLLQNALTAAEQQSGIF